MIATGDRAFRQLVLLAIAALVPLGIAMALTLAPGAVQRALHGYDGVAQACIAALYGVGRWLPPLGIVTLVLALAAFVVGAVRTFALLARTRALTSICPPAPTPPSLSPILAGLGLAGRVSVFESSVPVAFTAGLLRTRVWISTAAIDALAPKELEAVLVHERAHLRRRDPLRIALARSISSALFFVPLADALRRRFEAAKELDADREVMAVQEDIGPLAGAIARLGLAPTPLGRDLAVGAWSLTTARIDHMTGVEMATVLPRPPRWTGPVSALALSGLLLLALGQAARANIVPAVAWVPGSAPGMASVHVCPLPLDGPLF